jgi:hypothetical protein
MCTAGIGYVAVIIWISIYSWVSELPNQETIYIVAASASVASNSVICVLPIWWIWRLEKPKREKFAATIATGWGVVWVNPLERLCLKEHPLIMLQYYVCSSLSDPTAQVRRPFKSNRDCWGDEHMDVRHHRMFVHAAATNVLAQYD